MITLDDLFDLFDAYGTARGISPSRVSTLVFGAGHKIVSLRAGRDIGVRRLGEAGAWFSAHWPEGVDWPEGVERPALPEADPAGPTAHGPTPSVGPADDSETAPGD